MHELLSASPSPTENLEEKGDANAGFPRTGIGEDATGRRRWVGAIERRVGQNSSDFNCAEWVMLTFPQTVGLSMTHVPEFGDIFLSARQAFIEQVHEDLNQLPDTIRSSSGAEFCRRFVEGVGMALAFVPGVRCAVFGDEEDGVELLAHSRASMRQVSFEFGPHENSINIISIDEKMHPFERTCGIDKVRTLAEAIAWLKPR